MYYCHQTWTAKIITWKHAKKPAKATYCLCMQPSRIQKSLRKVNHIARVEGVLSVFFTISNVIKFLNFEQVTESLNRQNSLELRQNPISIPNED